MSVADSWAIRAPYPFPARHYSMSAATLDDKIHLVGGNTSVEGSSVNTLSSKHHQYNPSTNTWTLKKDHPVGGVFEAAASVWDNKMHIMGNRYTNRSVEHFAYDPLLDSWSTKAPVPGPAGYAGIALVWDNSIHLVHRMVNNWQNISDSPHHVYHPNTNTWSSKGILLKWRHYAVGGVIGDTFYVFVPTFTTYNTITETWTEWARHLPLRGQQHFAGGVIRDKLFIVGGQQYQSGYLRQNTEYDPETDAFTIRASMPTARGHLTATACRNRLYAIGGRVGNSLTRANEEYTPIGIGGYVHRWAGSKWQEEEVYVYEASFFGPYWRRGEVYVWSNGQWVLSS